MTDRMTTTKIAKMHGVTPETIRNRAIVVEEYLSEEASSRGGSTRVFDSRDVAILRRVNELSDGGRTYDEIKTIIGNEVEQGLFDGLYEADSPTDSFEERSIVSYERQLGRYEKAMGELTRDNEDLKRRLDRRNEELARKNQELAEAQHKIGMLEGKLAFVQEQKEDTREQREKQDQLDRERQEAINVLNREVGRLEAEIMMLKQQMEGKE